jgi:serine/threonine protein kinase
MNTPSEETLFANTVALPASERPAYLERACAGDAALRARVEALVQAHLAAGSFLDAPPTSVAAAVPPAAPTEAPGDCIGPYKLLQKIGEGGCGTVYMAGQEAPVRRRVALKVIKLGMDTKEVVARFEAERQALALMDHPNIARVLDAGATDAGRPYFVMELVRGIPITKYCDEYNLATAERIALFIQVCHAVQHAHQKGIIHRDIKPSNILVTINDGVPVPKVIDFGIAKATTGRLTDRTLFTAFEQFIGTPAYMSPEQAQLSSLDVDTRSDIYSLGVLLYELLTGRTPFETEELLQAGLDEIRRCIREVEPPKPSTRLSTLGSEALATTAHHRCTEPPKLIHLVRGDLDWIVMRCLEKNRSRRYATANGLARDLERHLHDEPVSARPPSALYRVQKLVRRNKLAVGAASAIAAALVIGLAVSSWMYSREKIARERAVTAEQAQVRLRQQAEADRKKAETESSKSRQVAQFLKDMLSGVGPSVALGRDATLLREILDKTAERVGKDLKDQPEVEAELRQVIGNVQRALGEYDKAEAMLRESLAIRRRIFGEEHLSVADSLLALGGFLDERGRFPEADAAGRECLAIRTKLLGPESAGVADVLYGMATSLINRSDFVGAEPLALQTLAMRRKLLGGERPEVADALENVGLCLVMRGDSAGGEARIREAIAIYRRVYGEGHPRTAGILMTLGMTLLLKGDLNAAEPLLREALATQRKLTGSDNPNPEMVTSLTILAACLSKRGDYGAAEPLWRKALALQRERLGDKHPGTIVALDGLAEVLMQRADYVGAEALFLEAEKIAETTPLVSADLRHDAIDSLANLYATWAKTDPAKAALATEWKEKLEMLNRAEPGRKTPPVSAEGAK